MNTTHVWLALLLTLLCTAAVFAKAGLERLLVIEHTETPPSHSEGDVVVLADGILALVSTRFRQG